MSERPRRVLHVVAMMKPGGIESWLMRVLRRIDRDRFRWDFLVHATAPGSYDDEIRALGGSVIPCPRPHAPWRYAARMRAILRQRGPYHAVHSHMHHYCGLHMWTAARAGVPCRIAHAHTMTLDSSSHRGWVRSAYIWGMRRLIRRYATCGLGASDEAAAELFGEDWKRDPRFRVLYCGIDVDQFFLRADREGVRREFGLRDGAFLVGHVGSLTPIKNHRFFIDVAQALARRCEHAAFLLVGDGTLRGPLEELVRARSLQDRFRFAGARHDVPRLLLAMDAFVFPSFQEGLGLAMVEAQAAGLPCFCTDSIPRAADVVPSLVHRIALTESPEYWAARVLETREQAAATARGGAAMAVAESAFNVTRGVRALEEIYGHAGAG